MRFKKREMRPYITRRSTCDLCGSDLATRGWSADEVTIEARIGEVYPETDTREVYELDCCAPCFLGKIRPAIEALGVKVRERSANDDDAQEEPVAQNEQGGRA